MEISIPQFDDDTWAVLPSFLENLPEPILINIWGDPHSSHVVAEAVNLAATLSDRFDAISFQVLPKRINFDYYPVLGIMGLVEEDPKDHGVRLIGLPVGYQMTSLIAAIQSVSFKGMTSEAKTRIQLHRLSQAVTLELFTTAQDETGTQLAQAIFNMAVVSDHIRSFLIMVDQFPEAAVRYSVQDTPHLVINGSGHIQGWVEEAVIVERIAAVIDVRN